MHLLFSHFMSLGLFSGSALSLLESACKQSGFVPGTETDQIKLHHFAFWKFSSVPYAGASLTVVEGDSPL